MTENTKTLGIRLEIKDKEKASRYFTRESIEHMLRQIDKGEITITSKGVVIERVNTERDGVNTTIEPSSKKNAVIDSVNTISESVNTSVNTADCENCPYANDLDMTEFDDVCKLRGIDRQKALDKCVQMLWR